METETNDNPNRFLDQQKKLIDDARKQVEQAAADSDWIGKQIGPYVVREPLGEGGFGTVYLAERTHPHRQRVALKVIKDGRDTRDTLARFEAEGQALGLMNHDNVAKVFDAGATDDGKPYFVMEYVQGTPITDHCDKINMGIADRLALFIQVCEGVQHAHQKAIIHRDLKPSNILVTDEHHVAKVIDFGLAKAMGMPLTEKTLDTERGMFIATPEYMSPEQTKPDNKDIDTRTDVYSLGVLLYELLSGVRPFDLRGMDTYEKVRIVREVEPQKPSTRLSMLASEPEAPAARADHPRGEKVAALNAKPPRSDSGAIAVEPTQVPAAGARPVKPLPHGCGSNDRHCWAVKIAQHRRSDPKTLVRELRGDLDWITMRAMDKDRTRRYATASELAADIQRHLRNEPVIAGPPNVGYRLKKFVRRNRSTVTAGTLIAVSLVAGIIGITWQYVQKSKLLGEVEDAYLSLEKAHHAKDEQRRLAEGSRDEANAAMGFLGHMLASANPIRGKGKEVTVAAMMDQAVAEIDPAARGKPLSEFAAAVLRKPRAEATVRKAIGDTYWALGKYRPARSQLEIALKLKRHYLGDNHLDVALVMIDLAGVHMDLCDFESAGRLYHDALAIQKSNLGDDPHVAETLFHLGLLRHRQADYDGAQSFYHDALTMQRKLRDDDDVLSPHILNGLGIIQREKGDYPRAEGYAREAVALYRKLGDDHPLVAWGLDSLGLVLHDKGDLVQCEQAFREALAINRDKLGDEHKETAMNRCRLGAVLAEKGDVTAAEALVRDGLFMQRILLGDDHVDLCDCLNPYAKILMKKNDWSAAEPVLRESLVLIEKWRPADGWGRAYIESLLGGCVAKLGRFEDAEPLLVNSQKELERGRGASDRFSVEGLRRIIALFEGCGQPHKAMPFRKMLPDPKPTESFDPE